MHEAILLPVDLNHEASWTKALPAALSNLADSGTLHLLGIVPDFGSAMVAGFFPPDFEAKAVDHMQEALEAFATEHVPAGVTTKVHVGHGHIAPEILRAASSVDAAMIVMASHPPSDMRDLLVGSSAGRVVRQSHVSVLVVR